MKAINLRTEYMVNPIGIDLANPRLQWNCENGVQQTAYELRCTNWESGKVESNAMHAAYPKALASGERVVWQVRLWDENDTPGEWSEEVFFEAGLLAPADWRAKWITGNYSVNKKNRYPVDCFRKPLSIDKKLTRARLYITACGLYEARLNGVKIGGFCLAPGYTDYRKRVQYQTYDVTAMLNQGSHALTVQLADGWYRGSCGAWAMKNQFGTQTKFMAQLALCYEDGTVETIITDESWDWSNDGPIRFADNKDGEIVDAGLTPSYSGKASIATHPVTPTASNNVPVTEHERLRPRVSRSPNGKQLFDFGQNIAGWLEFQVQAEAGQRIRIRCGEMLDNQGNLTLKNIQCVRKNFATPLQEIDYTCKEGVNCYKTTFAVFGFQYVEVDSHVAMEAENITAIAVYSDMAQTGFFESSNQLLNRFVQATLWSTKGNSLDIPTDCPTRERHGWTGDAQIFFTTAGYLMDYAPFARKYVQDLYDRQGKDGKLPQIVPYGGVDSYMQTMDGSVGWADAGVLIPYRFCKLFDDDSLIRKHYDGMARYARFMMNRCGKFTPLRHRVHLRGEGRKYLVNCGQSYGEWAEPADVCPNSWTNVVLPHPEESTAYTAFIMKHMAEIATYLGHEEDRKLYETYQQGCTLAYRELVRQPGYTLDTDRQAKLVRPLYMGLLDEAQADYATKRLIRAMENYDWRLGTGFLSTPFILNVLAGIDRESAYRLLENEKIPGWLAMPKNGATTIWEDWEGQKAQKGIGSLNHYSKGAACEWLFQSMCGIGIDGENHFCIAPQPGGNFTFAKAAYQSVYGWVECGWEAKDGGYLVTLTIPANTTADLCLGGGNRQQVQAGTHQFLMEQADQSLERE